MAESKRGFKKFMGLWGATDQGIAAMLGGGVLVLTGFAAGLTGQSVPLAVLLIAMLGGFTTLLIYAELGTARPEAGGGLLWIREGINPVVGHFAGWFSWFAHIVACVVYALSFGFNLAYFLDSIVFPLFGAELPQSPEFWKTIFAIGAIVLLSIVNIRGVKSTELVGRIVVLSSLGTVCTFIVFGVISMLTMPGKIEPTGGFLLHGVGGLLGAMGLLMIQFVGFETVAQSAEEMKNPKRDIPRALFLSFGVILLIGVLVTIVSLFGVKGSEPSWKILSDAGEQAIVTAAGFFPFAAVIVPVIIIGGAVVGFAALNATIFSASHVFYAMAHEGRSLPAELEVLHPKYRTPIVGVILSAILMAFMIRLPIQNVAALADLIFIVLFALVHVAFFRFRKKYRYLPRPFKVPLHPLPSIVALITFLVLGVQIIQVNPWSLVVFLAWLIAGMLVYRFYVEPHERGVLERGKVREDVRAVNQESRYFIFFPVIFGTSWWREILPYVSAIARQKNGTVFLWSLIERPLKDEKDWISKEEDEALDRFFEEVRKVLWDIGVSRSLRSQLVSDASTLNLLDMTDTILQMINEFDIDLLVIPHEYTPWHERFTARSRMRIRGEAFQKILREARCDLLMFKTGKFGLAKSQLIPLIRSVHNKLVLEVASSFKEALQLKTTLLHIRNTEQKKDHDWHTILSGVEIPEAERKVIDADIVTEKVLEESEKHDILLMGAAKTLAFGSPAAIGNTAEYLIEHCHQTVFVCYHHGAFPLFAPLSKLFNSIMSKLRTLKVEG